MIAGNDSCSEIYQCYAMGGRINFQSQNISLCHSLECVDPVIEFDYSGKENLADVYEAGVKSIIKDVQSGKRCSGCSMKKKMQYMPPSIKVITLNINTQCNCRCLYCCSHTADVNRSVNILPFLKQLEARKLVDRDCFFDFGGGEPTIDAFFGQVLSYVSRQNYVIRVNTNALWYSEILEKEILENDDINIRISVDAGIPETYLRIKGNKQFDMVWKNIKKYRECTKNIAVKYVICKYNISPENLEGFVRLCKNANIDKIYIDIDHDAYTGQDKYGWSDYLESMLKAAYTLESLAEIYGIEALIGYVWTAGDKEQDTYDYNYVFRNADGGREVSSKEMIKLPTKFVRPKEKAPITYDKYNNIDELRKRLKDKKVFLYGAGYFGTRVYNLLKNHVNMIGVIDSDSNLWGTRWDALTVEGPDVLKNLYDIELVITSGSCNDIMSLINQKQLINLKNHIFYLTRADFDYYEKKNIIFI